MKKVFRIMLWTIIVLMFVGTFVFLYLNSREKEILYADVHPTETTIERSTVLTGKIEPRDEIQIKPQISGIISEICVEAGEFVKEGDIIAKIKVIPEASQLSSAQSRVNSATIDLNDAQVKYDRAKALYDKKVISREEFESAKKDIDKATEELSAAKDTYTIIREGVSKYNANESNTLVRATITGLILDVPVKVGSSVIQANTMNDGTTVATIADMNNLIFIGNVDETEVGSLRVGMPMNITIGAMPDIAPTAVIEYISPKGTDNGGANTFEIKAALTLDSAEGLRAGYSASAECLRAGYSANAAVILDKAENVLSVPEGVVVFEGDSTFVYILADSAKHVYTKTAFKAGLSDGINLEVKEGFDKNAVLRGDEISQK